MGHDEGAKLGAPLPTGRAKALQQASSHDDIEELRERVRAADEQLQQQIDRTEKVEGSVRGLYGRYHHLFRFVAEPLVFTDRVGTIRDANPASEELFQIEHRSLVGKPLATLIARDDLATFRRLLDGLKQAILREAELAIERRGGQRERVLLRASLGAAPHDVLWGLRLVKPTGRAYRSGTFRTMASARESSLASARVTEQLDASLHSALDCLDRAFRDADAEGRKHALRLEQIVRSSVGQTLALIELLRLQEGGLPVDKTSVDVSALVELALNGVAPEAMARGVPLRCQPLPGLMVEGDHARLAQALLAIFCHALRSADGAQPMVVSLHDGEGWATLKVRYQQKESAADAPAEAFEWLGASDLDALTARLGVTVARGNAILHGGMLSIAEDATGSAAFILRLPRANSRL